MTGFSDYHLYFDDLCETQSWESPGRTVTTADIVNFAGFSGDFNPMHMNHHFAAETPFRQPIMHGFGVFSMSSGIGLMSPPTRTIALIAVLSWKFLHPVFIGDTVHVRTRIVSKTVKGRGKRGEVVWHRSIVNQNGKVVQEGEIATLVECRPVTKSEAVSASIESEKSSHG